jgi:hypothetical protein
MLSRQFSAVDLKLIGVENDFLCGFFDFEGDLHTSLVAPFSTQLQVEDGDGIVGGFDTGQCILALKLRNRWQATCVHLRVRENLTIGCHSSTNIVTTIPSLGNHFGLELDCDSRVVDA